MKKPHHIPDISFPLKLSLAFHIYTLIAVLTVSSCMLWILWGGEGIIGVFIWFTLVSGISFINGYWLVMACTEHNSKEHPDWYNRMEIILLILWAILPIMFWPQDSLIKQVFFSLCLILFASVKKPGHISGSGAYIIYFLLFLNICRMLVEGSSITIILAFLIALFSGFLLIIEQIIRHFLTITTLEKNSPQILATAGPQIKSPMKRNFKESHRYSNDLNGYPKNNSVAYQSVTQDHQIRCQEEQEKQVLVVDDNRINQQVVGELLFGLRLNVKMADNGGQAIEMLQQEPFDLILMDIQMPEMDGYETTRAIRRYEQFKQIPIIAMTAYAQKEDRQHCLDAGMNDHACKPFEVSLFFQTIAKWLNLEMREIDELMKQTPDLSMESTSLIDLPGIEQRVGLNRVKNNQGLYYKILTDFYQEYLPLTQQLKDSLQRQEYQLAARMIHRFKGAAGNIGATDSYFYSKKLEQLIKAEQPYEQAMSHFEQAFDIVMDGLAMLPRTDAYRSLLPHCKLSTNFNLLSLLLAELSEYIHDASPQAVDLLPKIHEAANGHLNELLTQLTEDLYTFHFEDAENTLQKIHQELEQLQITVGG